MWTDLLYRLRCLVHRNTVEEEMEGELAFHLERQAEKYRNAGLAPAEALRRARLALGGLDQVKEECRQVRGLSMLETAIQDLRYTIRGMRRSPGFTVVAILTLGLGTGAIATVFTLAHTLLFLNLPVDRPDRLVEVQAIRKQTGNRGGVSYPDYVHFRDHNHTLEGLAVHCPNAPLLLNANQQSRQITGAIVSANYFPVLGLKPAIGRFFTGLEDRVPDRDRVAVLSYQLWQSWFDTSPDVLGKTVKINGAAFTVIGVTPPNFRGIIVQPAQIFLPAMTLRVATRFCSDALASDCRILNMIGRLDQGHTIEESRAEMGTLAANLWTPASDSPNQGVAVLPAIGASDPDVSRRSSARFVTLLAAVAGLLLLVCCANMAGLLVSRNSARGREFAIRLSLGAGSRRLVRQLVTESLILTGVGGAVGVFFSVGLTQALNSRFYSVNVSGRPLYYDFTPAPTVILSVLTVSALAGLVLSLVPAWSAIRTGVAQGLKRQATSVSCDPRVGRWLVGTQTALAVALAGVAGLLVSSVSSQMAGINYDPSHVALMRLRPRLAGYAPEKAQRFQREAIDRLERLPGVESLSLGAGATLVGRSAQVSLPQWQDSQQVEFGSIEIAPRYFATLRTPVVTGREFEDSDTLLSTPVAILNQSAVRRLFPAGRALGAILMVNQRPHQIVGIVKDVLSPQRGEPSLPYVFTPYWQNAAQLDATLCIRVKGDPSAALAGLVREVNRIDPDVPVDQTIPLRVQLEGIHQSLRITASFVGYAAVVAVFLSAIGLYAALAFSVSRRTKEIGIRMAVGAPASKVSGMVIREGMLVVLAGVAAGGGLAFAGARFLHHLLYDTGPADVVWYAVAALAVTAIGLLACWVPARRAIRVEPIVALREQ